MTSHIDQRWIVTRTRPGDGAPSMSISIRSRSTNVALIRYLDRFGQQPVGTQVDIRQPSTDDVTASYVRTEQLWERLTPGDPLLAAAQDFEAAAVLLADGQVNAPVHVLADLLDEVHYLRHGDRSDLGTLEGAHERYAETSRASRRRVVCMWIRSLERGDPSMAQQQALNHIGGIGD